MKIERLIWKKEPRRIRRQILPVFVLKIIKEVYL